MTGDSLKSFLVALVVLDPDATKKWLKEKGKVGEVKDYLNDKDLKNAVMIDLDR